MIINRLYRVNYHDEDSIVDDELVPDKLKTRDFKVFTLALDFAQIHCDIIGASGIEEIDIDRNKSTHLETEVATGNKWEVTQTEHYLLT